MGGGLQEQKSETQVHKIPGLFGIQPVGGGVGKDIGEQVRELSSQAGPSSIFATPEGSSVSQFSTPSRAASQFAEPFKEALLNPQFGPQTASEQNLLDSVMSLTQGASSLRGLGPATQGALAQDLAPTLILLRQNQLQDLGRALEQDLGSQITQRSQDIGAGLESRGQTLTSLLGQREQDIGSKSQNIQNLLSLAELVMPQIVSGQQSRSRGIGGQLTGGKGA